NLSGIFGAPEPPPEAPPPPTEVPPPPEPRERVVVRAVSVRAVALRFTRPDGLRVAVDGLSLEGAVDARPRTKALEAELALAVRRVGVERPGATLAVTELATGARASLAVGGAGRVLLGP